MTLGKITGKVQASRVKGGIWTPTTTWQDNLVLYEWGTIVGNLLAGQPDGKPYAIGGMYLEYESNASGAAINPTPTFDRAGGVQAGGYWESLGTNRDYLRVKLDSTTVGSSVPLGATATVTITAFGELNSTDKVNLIATDGTNYNFINGSQDSAAGTWESDASNNQTATNLMNVINTSSGPAGTRFSATVDGAVVTITQATVGLAGNTTVTLTDSGTAGMTSTSFVGGGPSTITTTFVAQTTGTTGSKTTSPVAFSDAVNSRVYGCALVAYPDFDDKSQDLVLSRFYFSSTSQIDKSPGSNIGISWPITLS